MGYGTMPEMLLRGRKLYGRLLDEAVQMLRNIDTHAPEELAGAMERRHDCLLLIREFEDELAGPPAAGGRGAGRICRQALEEFHVFREATIRSVLEIDSLVTALARERMNLIRCEMTGLARAREALAGYGGGGTSPGRILSDAA